MQKQDNTEMCYRKRNRRTWLKTSPQPSKSKSIYQRIKLEYTNNKRPSKPSLPHVLEPSELLLPTGFSEPCLLQLSRILQYARLHPPMIGSFQYFPAVPKPHLTLKLDVVSVWDINLSRIQRWRGRSKGKLQGNVQMIMGITISNSQVYFLGFLSEKHSLQYVGNKGIYSVGKDLVKYK